METRRAWRLLVALAALACVVVAAPALAEDEDFRILDASVRNVDGVYYLDARIDYELTQAAREALRRGVTLGVELAIDVRRSRRWRPDKSVAELLQEYEVEYHALSERYLVRNLNSGEQDSYATLSAALRELGVVDALPVLDAALLPDDREHYLRLKASLEVRSFRGPLRLLSVFFDELRLDSGWYTWPLEP